MTNWSAWSREAVDLAQNRNDEWQRRFDLADAAYRWDLERAEIVFQRSSDEVVADLCLIGTGSAGSFLWAWANDSLPEAATRGLDVVQAFGEQHDLALLTLPEFPADRAQGLELAAVVARIQDAAGVFVDSTGDALVFFTLSNFRARERKGAG